MDGLIALVMVPAGGLVVLLAYALGRLAGMHQTIPWRPIFQLVEHRSRCLAHDHLRLQRELAPRLGIPEWAFAELATLRRPLLRRARRIAPP